ncbi:MAG: hydrogenase subunit MbhD domain-containing protein [Dethiobacteria bacterium]|jgi:energy-converting hydrogenase B subunit D
MIIAPEYIIFMLLSLLILAVLAIFIFDDLLLMAIIYGGYGVVMAFVWQMLNAPDIAITEAAVAVGSSVLMITVISRLGRKPQ